jgi:hypothetical protein
MGEKPALTPREAMEQRKARLREELAALDHDMAELAELERLAAKYGLVVQAPGGELMRPAVLAPTQSQTDIASQGLTVGGLIDKYLTDPKSKFHGKRWQPRQNTESHCRRIKGTLGSVPLAQLKGPDIERQFHEWAAQAATKGRGNGQAMAVSLVNTFRSVANFGATVLEEGECVRLHVVLRNLRFPKVQPREAKPLTPEHIDAIIRTAHEMGAHTIALAVAFQCDCHLHQRDTIGEWVRISEKNFPFTTIVDTEGGRKWGRGLRWNEISNDRILRHTTSWLKKIVEVDLTKGAPRVMRELDDFLRRRQLSELPRDGVIIINEETGLPYGAAAFRAKWRRIAKAAGVPDDVKNMDSRVEDPVERIRAAE